PSMLCMWLSTIAGGIVVLCVSLKIFLPYFWQDLIYFLRRKRSKATVKKWTKNGIHSIIDLFMQTVEKKKTHKPFLIYEGTVYAYQDVDRSSNRVAQAFLHYGNLKKGDTVALLRGNGPDFIHVWFGLAKLGTIMAFLNTSIHSRSLLLCINTCAAKALVIGEDCLKLIEKEFILNLLENNVAVWLMSTSSPSQHVQTLPDKLDKLPDNPVPSHLRAVTDTRNTALYIFTSGSTGFPKAIITHLRMLAASLVFTQCGAISQDIMYVTLPLYHISASLLGISGCIHLGATCVLKKKFSARQFWNDCRKYNVTMFLYIAELCHYLCNQPCKEEDRVHEVCIALGNGIRPSVWKEFLMRFGPIKIFEFYGSTEGSLSFLNYSNKIGAVGRAGIFSKVRHIYALTLYMFTCIPFSWPAGKPGLLVLQVTEDTPFSGYVGNKEASEKKLLCNVFVEGDVYLDTGDLLEMDEDGFLYFTDRVGDTFRHSTKLRVNPGSLEEITHMWKGENVATLEVAEIIGMVDFVQEVNVYGVSVKNYEGRTGMAAIVLKGYHTFNGERLYKHVEDFLPSYAKPRFVRIMDAMQITTTFKHQKTHLENEGFNPEIISEPLYFMYEPACSYIPLTKEIYQKVVSGEIHL
ncbi:S27A6 protein, partial [Sylvia atricapilla]|nr:S27A6 protein [Sylvia atricapilla]